MITLPDLFFGEKVKRFLENILYDLRNRIVQHVELTNSSNTVATRELRQAINLLLTGELRKHAKNESQKAVHTYHASLHNTGKKEWRISVATVEYMGRGFAYEIT